MIVVLCLLVALDDSKLDKEALKKLEGAWQLTSSEHGGAKGDKKDVAKIKLTVKGKAFVSLDGVEVKEESAVEALDAKAKPATIDLRITGGSDKDKTVKGIWKRDGDTLTVCVAEPNRERPKKFAGREGSGHTLLVFQKAK